MRVRSIARSLQRGFEVDLGVGNDSCPILFVSQPTAPPAAESDGRDSRQVGGSTGQHASSTRELPIRDKLGQGTLAFGFVGDFAAL